MSINKRSYQLLGLLVIVWGSSFLLIDRALLFFTPEQVVGYRLVIGAITMFAIALYYGKSFPRTITPWLHFIVYAVIGNILPYLLIATGQLTITSGMAGLLMAFMPLVTLVLAHIFLPNDKLTRFKILGFIIGISGVLFILGPSINNGNNTLFGILLVLGASCAYAINTIIASRLPSYDPLVSSASVLLVASLLSFFIWPNIFFINFSNIPFISGVSILLLGALPTGIAAFLYFIIINTAGATFLSNINYLIPVVAFFLGALLLGEDILWQNILALLLIISGIFISRKNT
ncbi:DMT family transporter [Candidatus Pseudothioglobus singularis]|nr:DMT family transporter [Candidatus Pseudothioglobus singularis]MDB4598448.1 DMT family transporter [Candidatus Pseudothioglobus singularis]